MRAKKQNGEADYRTQPHASHSGDWKKAQPKKVPLISVVISSLIAVIVASFLWGFIR